MSLINTKKTAFFLKSGAVLPTPPADFVETNDPIVIAPQFATEEINRVSGKLNAKDSYVDLCRTKVDFTVLHNMKASSFVSQAFDTLPEYGEMLVIGGFKVNIGGGAGSETVIYTNNTDEVKKGSAVVYVDGNKFEMTNALASALTFDFTIGKVATLSSQYSGYLDSPEPTPETNPSVTLIDEPLLIVSCADIYSFDGDVIPTENVKITTNPEIQDLYTMGGANGIKENFVSDYSLELSATFRVDSADYAREAQNISAGNFKAIVVKIGLDKTSTEINGKSVTFDADLSKTITYSDTTDKDTLLRTVTYRLMNDTSNADTALAITHGFYA